MNASCAQSLKLPDAETLGALSLLHRVAAELDIPLLIVGAFARDVIPFGGVMDPGGAIHWPNDGDAMSVLGFQEAFEHARQLELTGANRVFAVRFITPPGLVMLKLIAWNDRKAARRHDVHDIAFVVKALLETAGGRAMLKRHPDLAGGSGVVDLDCLSARLIGREIGGMALPMIRGFLHQILEHEVARHGACPFLKDFRKEWAGDMGRAQQVLLALWQGLNDSPVRPAAGAFSES